MVICPYTAELARLQTLYPDGEVVIGTTIPAPVNGPALIAYILPPAEGVHVRLPHHEAHAAAHNGVDASASNRVATVVGAVKARLPFLI